MAKPTKGPWVAQPGTTTGREIIAPGAPKTRRVVARCGGQDREANASLIAAAPDMLAALREAYDLIHAEFAETNPTTGEAVVRGAQTTWFAICAAIAKAEDRAQSGEAT